MTVLYALVITILLFYFSIGIGTAIKFSDSMRARFLMKFVFILPVQTIALFFAILRKILSSRQLQGGKSLPQIFWFQLRLFFIGFFVCLKFMPVFSGKLACIYLSKFRMIQVEMADTQKECYEYVDKVVFCH